ncbi:glutaredoxin family protein [Candidatus Bathyarchaeota archaeon]|jgi:glutaredoxin-like protein NrdH|nr:glutaredoxin family protein [Candidatus Bathyarchaeota archaeon]MBT4320017.1 glutaredoxin family protein [Candidatus Bathyarchaeota archaeon]MBT4423852.1 glutaredoxin family protein [Candidatus Bathyarchaeota archaeon]MBT5642399.1 glutaredoxin family protein [Candidatus Bathyarchaeota archaeon]MBT6604784.1 glutaredoxin family protein [Candidatus Bathyarchaeota archaeon]
METMIVDGTNSKNKVFLYTLSTCGWCKKLKSFLEENSVRYEYIDLDLCTKEDQVEAVEELKAKKVPVAFPIAVINEDIVIQGFKKDDIVEALGL